jgi:hypothetical protein
MTDQSMTTNQGAETIYPVETQVDASLRHFAKVYKLTNQVVGFITYQEGNPTSNTLLPEDSDHFYWLEFKQTIRNSFDSSLGIAEELIINAYIDDQPIGKMDGFRVGTVWDPATKKILPRVDFGDMSKDLFYFDYTTWQWKVPTYEAGKMLIWNPMTRNYEEYIFSQQAE